MSRNVEIESHMPLSDQLAYSRLYDRFANNEVHRLAERDVWHQFKDYDGATRLDEHDLLRLQGLIGQARYREATFDLNATNYTKQASALGIRPTSDPAGPS